MSNQDEDAEQNQNIRDLQEFVAAARREDEKEEARQEEERQHQLAIHVAQDRNINQEREAIIVETNIGLLSGVIIDTAIDRAVEDLRWYNSLDFSPEHPEGIRRNPQSMEFTLVSHTIQQVIAKEIDSAPGLFDNGRERLIGRAVVARLELR